VTKKTDLGYKVIVNNAIWGLIFRSDAYRPLRIGQKSTGFVKTIREDGKVDVILRKAGLDGLNDAAQIILAKLEKSDNKTLYLTDNSDPEAIRLTLNMSKKMFKKGVGMLYKGGIIELEMDRIFLKE
jgi:predicted RNA-binding protein (virulence factor B family)